MIGNRALMKGLKDSLGSLGRFGAPRLLQCYHYVWATRTGSSIINNHACSPKPKLFLNITYMPKNSMMLKENLLKISKMW